MQVLKKMCVQQIKLSTNLLYKSFKNLLSIQFDRVKTDSFSERFEQQPRRAINEYNVSIEICLGGKICTKYPDEVSRRVIDLD